MISVYSNHPPAREIGFLPHSHPELEIGYFPHGHGVYTLVDRTYEIKAGDIFLFGADELHKVTSIYADEPMETVCIRFQPRAVFDHTVPEGGFELLKTFARPSAFPHTLDRGTPVYDRAVSLIERMRTEAEGGKPFAMRLIKAMLVELLVEIGRARLDADEPSESVMPHDRALAAVFSDISMAVDEIESRFSEDISVAELAEKCSMSVNFFTTCFKKINGVTPKRYITSRRIDYAIGLIKTTNLTMLDIATRCGFNSSAGFNKAFMKMTGRTPMMYRKAYEEKDT